ncbi:MAG: phage protein Gp36 family protein [Planctomycetota bacterium]
MATYASRDDVVARLTDRGVRWSADTDRDDTVSETENVATLDAALDYASDLIDGYVATKIDTASARSDGNDWLKGRCVDIATWRVASTGGRTPPEVLREDYDRAIELLQEVRDGVSVVPGYRPDVPGGTCPIHVIDPVGPSRLRGRTCRTR